MVHVTIKDLAKELNVSASTVSRALSDHPDISPATKARVRAMAEAMHYQPNLIAQSLQNRRSNTIGVIVPEIRHDFFSSAISGMEEVAYEAGYTIMVSRSNDRYEREKVNIQALAAHRVAGIIMSLARETEDLDHLRRIMRRKLPLVLFDRVADELDATKVVVDDRQGARAATLHLLGRGYRRIAHLSGPEHVSVSRDRLAGYAEALAESGLAVSPELVVIGGFHENDGRAGMERLLALPQRPDAVFAVNDPVAIGAFSRIREAGLAIPGDVALVGFSNNPNTTLIDPPLTTVNQPAQEMGRTAMGLLLEQLGSEQDFKPVTRELKTELVVRGST